MRVMKLEIDENEILVSIEKIILMEGSRDDKLLEVCKVLDDAVPYYNWTGFYLVDPEKDRMLRLGPYVGASTEHILIPFGDGICGQAAATGEMFLVDDVSKETNYLSCSIDVRSEIVLPIYKGQELIGELDIDSHDVSAFSSWDSIFLQKICDMVSAIL